MLGLSKSFVIFLILAILISIAMKNYMFGVWIMGIYAVVKFAWRFLTQ